MLREKTFWFAIVIITVFLAVFILSAANKAGGGTATGMASLGKKAFVTTESLFFYAMLFVGVLVVMLALKYFFYLFEREEKISQK